MFGAEVFEQYSEMIQVLKAFCLNIDFCTPSQLSMGLRAIEFLRLLLHAH